MRRGAVPRCLVALLAGLAVAACAGQGSDGGGGGGGGGGGANGGGASTKSSTGSNTGSGSTTTHHNGPTGPAFLVLPPKRFGAIALGDATMQTVTVKNVSDEPTQVDGVSIAGANEGEFEITDNGCAAGTTLQPGETCEVTVTFKPQDSGTRVAQLKVMPDEGQASTARVQGTGEAEGQSTDSGGQATDAGG
jgi:Abnormal spindle-like microcephaly-assoc'd, ASPM-SPD-2-Hydin